MQETNRVLIVDDEESNVDMLSRRLSRCGYDVVTARDGEQAVQMLSQSHVDLVLLDQMMPGMTGLEVLREIRHSNSPQQLPVIMVTAITEGAAIAEALDQGANDYVTKPLDFQIALARIRTQLARGREDERLRKSEEMHVLAARGTGEGVWDWDLLNDMIYCTPELHRLAGVRPHEGSYTSEACLSRVHPADRSTLRRVFDADTLRRDSRHDRKENDIYPDAPDEIACQFRFRHQCDRYRWFSLRGVTLRNASNRAVRRVGTITDVTARLTIDPLTGFSNKLVLVEEIEIAIEKRQEPDIPPFCVLLFDIDHFKLLKPSLTQTARQLLLVQVAQRLQMALDEHLGSIGRIDGQPPLLARIGEDEFAVLLDPVQNASEATALAERLTRAMRPSFPTMDREIFCSISTGIVAHQANQRTVEDVLRDANTAMFAAEMRGTGRWVLFEESMRQLRDQRLQMDIDLRLAVERGEFEVFYQSRVNLETAAICGFEALIRWNHPLRGMVSPLEFIPLAEETGLIHEIGLWVLEQACWQAQFWRSEYVLDDDFEVSVNLSARQCREPNLVEQVAGVLERTGLPSRCLNLELTESLLMEDVDQAKAVLQSLKLLGIGLKIDDFGTGYSSLKYLCEFPFDSLKIDRSFTRELDQENAETEEIVRTIVQMAGNLKMEVVAEGVETDAHVVRLRALGCRFGQGFLFSRPIDAASAERLLGATRESARRNRLTALRQSVDRDAA